jgi:hypothetical protein
MSEVSQEQFDALVLDNEALTKKVELLNKENTELRKAAGKKVKSDLTPNPGYKANYAADARVLVKALKGAPHHAEGDVFEVSGDQAVYFIRVGVAEFVEVKKEA